MSDDTLVDAKQMDFGIDVLHPLCPARDNLDFECTLYTKYNLLTHTLHLRVAHSVHVGFGLDTSIATDYRIHVESVRLHVEVGSII